MTLKHNKCLQIAALLSLTGSPVLAIPLYQYASTVIGFSSEYTVGNWSAGKILGAPDTFAYGDIITAWAPFPLNGSLEYITVGFGTPVYANGAIIRETYGNGFVYEMEARDTSGIYHSVWSGVDTSLAGSPVDFTVSWAETGYLVDALRIRTNTDHDLGAWEEIDAVTLRGNIAPSSVPDTGTTLSLLGISVMGLAALQRKLA